MVTTAGFRDVIHIGRRQRPQNYSIQQDIPWQANRLVERHLRFEIPERIVPPHGDVLVELDEQSVRRAAAEMRRAGVTAVAVCFLFSYLNPSHERRAAEILTEELPGAFICTSSDVIPQFREFERFDHCVERIRRTARAQLSSGLRKAIARPRSWRPYSPYAVQRRHGDARSRCCFRVRSAA